jgi:hypothetical protein
MKDTRAKHGIRQEPNAVSLDQNGAVAQPRESLPSTVLWPPKRVLFVGDGHLGEG